MAETVSDTVRLTKAQLDAVKLAVSNGLLDNDDELVDELHAELRRQGAFTIERFGKIALAQDPFITIVLSHLLAALESNSHE